MSTPSRPTGSNSEARFVQWIHDALRKMLNFQDSPTVKWSKTTLGWKADVTLPPRSSGGSDSGVWL